MLRIILFIHHAATVGGFALGVTFLWALAAPRPLWRTALLMLFTASQAFAFLKLLAYAHQHRDPLRERLLHLPHPGGMILPALCGAAFKLSVPLMLA